MKFYFQSPKRSLLVLNLSIMASLLDIAFVAAKESEPVTPHPPFYTGVEYFEEVNPIPCTTNDTATADNENSNKNSVMNGLKDERYRWKYFYVYMEESYTPQERANINDVLWTLSQKIPCVPFGVWPRYSKPVGDYVHLLRGPNNGCSSYCGRQGGRQIMNLQSPGCMHKGTITHEMLHALGLHHEHGSPDRDDYIEIQWENVEPGLEHAFQKYSPDIVSNFGVPYNIRSIMHYDNLAFTKNGKPTILAKIGNTTELREMGSLELQPSDIEKLQRMYNCTDSPSDVYE